MIKVVVDADVILKLSVLDLFWEALQTIAGVPTAFATLESIQVSCGIRRDAIRLKKTGSQVAADRLLANLTSLRTLDPVRSPEEAGAAAIVKAAQELSLPIDSGEATLMSIAIARNLPYLTTSDRKAICSLEELRKRAPVITRLTGRIVAFEELLCRAAISQSFSQVAGKLAAGRRCDGWLDAIWETVGCEFDLYRCIDARLSELRRAAPGYLIATRVHEALSSTGAPKP